MPLHHIHTQYSGIVSELYMQRISAARQFWQQDGLNIWETQVAFA